MWFHIPRSSSLLTHSVPQSPSVYLYLSSEASSWPLTPHTDTDLITCGCHNQVTTRSSYITHTLYISYHTMWSHKPKQWGWWKGWEEVHCKGGQGPNDQCCVCVEWRLEREVVVTSVQLRSEENASSHCWDTEHEQTTFPAVQSLKTSRADTLMVFYHMPLSAKNRF